MQELDASLQPCRCTASATAGEPVDLLVVPQAREVNGEYSALWWMIVPPMMISPQPPLARSS